MACEEYQEVAEEAEKQLERAALARQQAEINLDAAWAEFFAALAAMLGCFLLLETPPLAAACEIAAYLAQEKAEKAIESAEIALELADQAESEAAEAWSKAHDTYCDCLRVEGAGDFPQPGEIWQDVEEAEAAIDEAEEALAEAESDLEEVETLLAEAEDALAEAEDEDVVLVG